MPVRLRRFSPPKFSDYKKYKPFLRSEFEYQCIYCFISENEYGDQSHFGVEHFRPKSIKKFKSLTNEYDNLFYACNACNSYKGTKWPSDDFIKRGLFFLNPCDDDLDQHYQSLPNGSLESLSKAAEYTVKQLRLNRQKLIGVRIFRKQIPTLIETLKEKRDLVLEKLNSALKSNDQHKVAEAKAKMRELTDLIDKYGMFIGRAD